MKTWIVIFVQYGEPEMRVVSATDVFAAMNMVGVPIESVISINGVILNN